MAGFDQGSLEILGVKRSWRNCLPSAFLEISKINKPSRFGHSTFASFAKGKVSQQSRNQGERASGLDRSVGANKILKQVA